MPALEGAYFEKFKSNTLGELHAVFCLDLLSLLEIGLIGNYDPREGSALVFLLDALVPLPQQLERVRVCAVVHQDHLVGFPQEVEGDLLEYVLACYVDQVQLNRAVALAFDGHVFHCVLTALGHHVVVIELAFRELMDDLGLAYCGLACDDHSRSENRH